MNQIIKSITDKHANISHYQPTITKEQSLQILIALNESHIESSFYIYDKQLIQSNINYFNSIPYAQKSIFFASMANDNPVLLKILQANGFGLFVNSIKHLRLGLSCGFTTDKIIFASTGIGKQMMKYLINHKIHINIDSLEQLKLYGQLNPNGAVGIRLNIDEKSKNNVFTGLESRIGIMESELPEIFKIAKQYHIKLTGTHVYLGTDVISLENLLEGVDKTLALSDQFPDLEFVDLGGGFPLERERFDFDQYKENISKRLENFSKRHGKAIKLILEPGRAMFGNTAYFFTQVTDIKERPDRYLVCVNASASLIPRAMFYESYNPVKLYNNENTSYFDKPVDIVGNTTYSRDFMAKKLTIPRFKIGDWLYFCHAGSYCYSMITQFLGRTSPPEYLMHHDGTIENIRTREDVMEVSYEKVALDQRVYK